MPEIRPIGISGSIPTINQLALGDLALNVYDGKAYIKKLVDSVETIVELGAGTAAPSVSSSYALSSSYSLTSSYSFFAETASSAINAQDILIYCKNQSGTDIAKGVVVRITGSNNSSDIPRIVTASYENDNNSANTLGITNQIIINGSEGYVMTEGVLKGINTNAYISGQLIYLGPTGSITGSAPRAPLHSVRLGEVVRHQSNNGSIYVRIDNGYELGELHDVVDNTTSGSYGDLLVKSGSVWTNSRSLTGSYGLTGSLAATSFTGSLLGNSTSASYAVSASTILITDKSAINAEYIVPFVANTGDLAGYQPLGIDTAGPYYNPSKNTLGSAGTLIISASSFYGQFTGSLLGNSTSASFASTASYVNPLTQSVLISGSLISTGSLNFALSGLSGTGTNPLKIQGGGGIVRFDATNTEYRAYSFNLKINSSFDGTGQSALFSSYDYGGASPRIGIGTLTPSAKLQVKGSGTTSATTAFRVENANASGSMVVLDNGNVGIGTITPSSSLHVFSDASSNADVKESFILETRLGGAGNVQNNFGTAINVYTETRPAASNIIKKLHTIEFRTKPGLGDLGEGWIALGAGFNGSITGYTLIDSFGRLKVGAAGSTTVYLPSYTLDVSGSGNFTNNLTVTGSLIASTITGSLLGTASFAITANTASYILNAVSSSFASTASFVRNAISASYVLNAISSSFASTASYINPLFQPVLISGSTEITGSTILKGDFTVGSATTIDLNATTLNINAPTLQVPSFALPYSPSLNIRTVMYDAVSNILFVTASLPGGSTFTNTGSFTGSFTGSLLGTGSWAVSSSQAISASYVLNAVSSSYALASLSSSYALSASFAENTTVVNNNTNNYVITGTGTSGTLNGESNLTFDGTTLTVTGDASITGNTVTNIQFNNQVVNNYTLGAADASKLVEMDVSIGNTVTVPTNASVGFAIGTQIMIVQQGTGQTTIAAAGGVTLRSAGGLLNLASQYSSCTVIKRGTDEWYVFGDLA